MNHTSKQPSQSKPKILQGFRLVKSAISVLYQVYVDQLEGRKSVFLPNPRQSLANPRLSKTRVRGMPRDDALVRLFIDGFISLSRTSVRQSSARDSSVESAALASLTQGGFAFAKHFECVDTRGKPSISKLFWSEDRSRILLYLHASQDGTSIFLSQLAKEFNMASSEVSACLSGIDASLVDFDSRVKATASITSCGVIFCNDFLLPHVKGAQEILDLIKLRSEVSLEK